MAILLNCVLLFLVLFFVYPLKFVFSMVIPALTRIGAPISMSAQDGRLMMWVYSAGFVARMLIFVLLYWNQYRRRSAFGLSDAQAFAARTGARTHLLSVAVLIERARAKAFAAAAGKPPEGDLTPT